MEKPVIIFLVGIAISVLVVVGGLANTYRLESKLKSLEAACVEEGKIDKLKYKDLKLVCDAESLSTLGGKGVGIQLKVVEAYREARQSKDWPYIAALGILLISILPLSWYFLLARIRELHDAITGK